MRLILQEIEKDGHSVPDRFRVQRDMLRSPYIDLPGTITHNILPLQDPHRNERHPHLHIPDRMIRPYRFPCVLSFQYIGDRPPDSLERLVIPTCHQCVFMLLIFFLRLPVPDTHFLDQFRGNPISLDRERMISVLRILFIDGSQIPLHVINLSRGFGKQFYNLIPHVLPHQAQACDVRRHLINKGRSWLILERIFFSHVIPEPPHRGNDAVGDFAVPDVPERPGYSSGTKRSPVFRQYL